jgi:predicted TIM-barrel fold metal-dependent hydrolase
MYNFSIASIAIADGHTHIDKDHVADKIISSFTEFYQMQPTSIGKGTVTDILDKMSQYQIKYTVLANFAPLKSIFNINEWTLSIGAKYKEFIPLISIHPEMSPDLVGLLKQYIENGAKGVKMHTGVQLFEPNDIRLKPLYQFCGKNKIPVTFHCGETSEVHINDLADIKHIYPVLESYQDVPFILTHMAAGKIDDVYNIAKTYKNVYFDTSITVTGEHCIKRIHDDYWEDDNNAAKTFCDIGCDRIIFGSDYPYGNPGSDIKRIMSLRLNDDQKKNILSENVLKIYKIK